LKVHILWLILSFSIISLIFYSIKEKKFSKLNFFTGFLFIPIILDFFASFKDLLNEKLIQIAIVFLKAGALTYGSGFVIVGILGQEVVEKTGWLTSQQFLDGIAFGQITPGPVVITATFIGYITSGLWGAIIATICVFTPTFIIVMLIASKVGKFRDNFYVKSLIKGANAAAIGAILSIAFTLSKDSIIDYYTLAIFLISLGILFFTKIKPIYLILISIAGGILVKLVYI
jgi:chromate transporter